eukprot:CAMPEP_0185724246 /NCGR_PEP_ID=MMETSP1171-20130828/788_1 /TAXON_ID=374046 /ORGANISM="Helicotheca tamensis, Strain CCMP826" /LENGTH=282 /DNA_ID=CAMNT_0028392053 /DNA_START=108 /DNA_END=956 /DNA_ORIENTATION=-
MAGTAKRGSMPGFKLSRGLSIKSNKLRRLIQSEQWTQASARCQSHPKEAKRWTVQQGFYEGKINTELLPIHMACALKAPCSFLEDLISAYPEAIESKESRYGRVPLHLACLYRTDFNSIKFLIARYTSGAQVRDAVGRTPLFYACSKGLSAELILMLLSACPDAAKVADYKGWLPLHAACHVGCPDEVILGLLEAYPGSHKNKTNGGSLPKVKRGLLNYWKESSQNMLDHVPSFTRNTSSFSRQITEDDDMDNMSVHSSTSWYELQKDLSVRVIVEDTSCYV